MKEDRLQSECWQWLWKMYPETRRCCWHVPNGGARTKVQAAQFTAMGVVAGVSDMHLFWQTQLYIIEFKVGAYCITDAQERYINAMTAQGAIFYECRTSEKWQRLMHSIILYNSPLQCEAHKLVRIGEDKWKVAEA